MLKTRIITAFFLLGGLLAAVFLLPPAGWLLFVSLICAGGAWEWGGLARFSTAQRGVFAVLSGATCALAAFAAGLGSEVARPGALVAVYAVGAVFWIGVVPLWLRRKWTIGAAPAAIAVGLVVLLPAALAMAYLRSVSPWLLLVAIAAVSMADIAAYFSGRAFGRRKLAPAISPGKTWEGVIGALVCVTLFGVILAVSTGLLETGLAILLVPPFMAAFAALSVEGDLFESLLKRQAGLKDSGSMLPGHGGILDRIDSLTSTLPIAALATLWFAN